ncbi:hypothetical protein DY000_02040341 [Brassica cretica]|uniref:Aspartic peptidase DDI1-type domain-containing protein n=1 Tax=Brassica cretica TaxID=69181 RepID=A0ABQ7BGW5_BRACR|nr:hypothetical protein DY000_02040341 [Brassica cretica]
MDGFTKRVLRIPVEKPFDEVYYTHRLWMFFRETKETEETEEDIRRMFHHVREMMKLRITFKKKSDPGKFAIPCVMKEPSSESFTFVNLSERSSGGNIRDLEVQIGNVHVLDIKLNWNFSLLLGRAFLATIGAVCDMNTNRLSTLVELGNALGYIAGCHCGAEYETEYSESIDTHTASSIDSNESPTTDEHYPTSLDKNQPVDHFTLPDQCCLDFAFQQPNKRGCDDYSIGSWVDSGFHESFAVETTMTKIDRRITLTIDRRHLLNRLRSVVHDRINALRPPPKPLANPLEPTTNPSDTTPEPMKVDEAIEGRRETKEIEEDIRRILHHVRERMKLRITLKKTSDPGKFAIPCVVKGIEFPHALCDTGASVNLVELGNDLGYIAACHCGGEYEAEYSESIETYCFIDRFQRVTDDR